MSQPPGTNIGPYLRALRRAKLLVLDVDGVLTEGRLHYGPRGEQTKVFHVRDGHGLKEVARAGITVAIISGRKSAAVARRAGGRVVLREYPRVGHAGLLLSLSHRFRRRTSALRDLAAFVAEGEPPPEPRFAAAR